MEPAVGRWYGRRLPSRKPSKAAADGITEPETVNPMDRAGTLLHGGLLVFLACCFRGREKSEAKGLDKGERILV
ncbi:MAG: hypothetical protein ACLFOY_07450 [Desulfatibacillaceae bacterium]